MGTIKVSLFHTRPVKHLAADVIKKQVDAANTFLKNYKISIDVYPVKGSLELPHDAAIDAESKTAKGKAQRDALRMAAHVAYPNGHGRVPVILCDYKVGAGEAPGSLGATSDWFPYVIVNGQKQTPDNLTMLHELCHCAGLQHPGRDPRLSTNDYWNIMSYGQYDSISLEFLGRTAILDWQLKTLKSAYFHYG